MREILFRGKRTDTDEKEWTYGHYYKIPNAMPNNSDRHVIVTINNGRGATLFHNPVKEETIGQYTGLEDKNGVKIFEGDILKAFKYGDKEQEFTLEVSFLNGCFMAGNWNWHEFLNKFRYIEIIGNVYDNPELKGEE